MERHLRIATVAALFLPLLAGGRAAAEAPPWLLPEACETALALSAAPEHLQSDAGLYVMTKKGPVERRESGNGFTCMINRDHPWSLKPTCYDAEGTRTILPKVRAVGEMLAKGAEAAKIQKMIADGFESGRFVAPKRPGVAYMLSHYNRPFISQRSRLGTFPPHIMFYAPDLRNNDIGHSHASARDQIHLPFIAYQGPHGFMIVRTEPASRMADHPLPACPAWVSSASGALPKTD